jgi:hypothetical protein
MMDKDTLHKIDGVMVDKVSIAFCLSLATIALTQNLPLPAVRLLVDLCGATLGCQKKDISAVFYATDMVVGDPEFLAKHQATEEQLLKAMYPGKKNHR